MSRRDVVDETVGRRRKNTDEAIGIRFRKLRRERLRGSENPRESLHLLLVGLAGSRKKVGKIL